MYKYNDNTELFFFHFSIFWYNLRALCVHRSLSVYILKLQFKKKCEYVLKSTGAHSPHQLKNDDLKRGMAKKSTERVNMSVCALTHRCGHGHGNKMCV